MAEATLQSMLEDIRASFRDQKRLGDAALAQVDERDVNLRLDRDANSIAVVVKHLHGNLLSRWTDFLTTDGEKPWRQRDDEFKADQVPLQQVMTWWEEGWAVALGSLDALTASDLSRTITIRGESIGVPSALLRQLTHASYHIGQMVVLAKHARGDAWTTLSVARGGSDAFNAAMRDRR